VLLIISARCIAASSLLPLFLYNALSLDVFHDSGHSISVHIRVKSLQMSSATVGVSAYLRYSPATPSTPIHRPFLSFSTAFTTSCSVGQLSMTKTSSFGNTSSFDGSLRSSAGGSGRVSKCFVKCSSNAWTGQTGLLDFGGLSERLACLNSSSVFLFSAACRGSICTGA